MTALPDYRKVAPARALLGWKQKMLAHRMGMSIYTVHRIERGIEPALRYGLFPAFTVLHEAGIDFHDRGVSLREVA